MRTALFVLSVVFMILLSSMVLERGALHFGAVSAEAQPADAGIPDIGSGSASTATPTTDNPSLVDEYKALKAKYDELKGAPTPDAKKLIYAALIALGLKLLLDAMKFVSERLNKGKKYIPWIAMFAAVPIALLSHFAAGASWFDSLVYAGAGPGAIVIHELLNTLLKKPQQAS